MTLNEVLDAGYYEMHRLWGMLAERKAHELMLLSRTIDNQQGNEESRQEFWESLKNMQPRAFRSSELPKHVLEKLTELFG